MKNLPQRERAHLRAHAPYSRKDKTPHNYGMSKDEWARVDESLRVARTYASIVGPEKLAPSTRIRGGSHRFVD